jgi:hypothetical protein
MRQGKAGRRFAGLLVAALVASVVGCTKADVVVPDERVLSHGEQFMVGVFEPPVARHGVLREGTVVVDDSGCLALQYSATGGTRVLAVPTGSAVSSEGTVFIKDLGAGETGPPEGPGMRLHVKEPVRFVGPEVSLGDKDAETVIMPPGCAAAGTRVLLVVP